MLCERCKRPAVAAVRDYFRQYVAGHRAVDTPCRDVHWFCLDHMREPKAIDISAFQALKISGNKIMA
jgi:hypothetical protein